MTAVHRRTHRRSHASRHRLHPSDATHTSQGPSWRLVFCVMSRAASNNSRHAETGSAVAHSSDGPSSFSSGFMYSAAPSAASWPLIAAPSVRPGGPAGIAEHGGDLASYDPVDGGPGDAAQVVDRLLGEPGVKRVAH